MIIVQSSMIASPVRGLTKELSVKVGVGIRRSLGNAEAMRSRLRSSTAQTKCERLGAGAQIDFTTTY